MAISMNTHESKIKSIEAKVREFLNKLTSMGV